MRFTKDHEWVEVDGDIATIGITAYAAEQLGDVVFVELPEAGTSLNSSSTELAPITPSMSRRSVGVRGR